MSLYEATTFEEFWSHYLRMHARPTTQRLHAVATLTAVGLIACGFIARIPLLLLLAPIADYAIAQFSHRVFEGNATQPWRHPGWHVRAELRLLRRVLTRSLRVDS
jgi:hypothetical protein